MMASKTAKTRALGALLALAACSGGASTSDTAASDTDTATDTATDGVPTASVVWELIPASGPSPRDKARLAPLGDKIVLFGGNRTNTDFLADTWIFDGEAWTELSIPGPDPRGTYGFAAWDGHVWLYGGVGRPLGGFVTTFGDLWRFDGATWTLIEADAPPGPRQSLAMMATANGLVLTSGIGDTLAYADGAWRYDGAWTELADGPGLLRSSGWAELDGRGYVVGGATPTPSDRVWSTDGLTWTAEATPLPFAVPYPAACPLGDRILAVGSWQEARYSALWSPAGAIDLMHDAAPTGGAATSFGERCVLFQTLFDEAVGPYNETWIAHVE